MPVLARAPSLFLTERATVHGLVPTHRKLKFDGDVTAYIRKLSMVVTRFINESCEYYSTVFDDDTQTSGALGAITHPAKPVLAVRRSNRACWLVGCKPALVLWATAELNDYAAVFRRHVFYHHPLNVVVECLRIAAETCLEVQPRFLPFVPHAHRS